MKVAFFDSKSYDVNRYNHPAIEFEFFDCRLSDSTAPLAAGCGAVCIFVNDDASAPVIAKLADLGIRLVLLRCAGTNHVDLEAAREAGLTVLRVPAYSPHAVAEHAIGLILALNRKIHVANVRTQIGDFRLDGLQGFDLYGRTAGIVGAGKIGRIVGNALRAFGMRVLYHDPALAESVPLDRLYRESHVISLHCPLLSSTRYMVNRGTLALMRDDAILINTSRGGLIDTLALIEALERTHLSAGLDVYEGEADYFFQDHSVKGIADPLLHKLVSMDRVLVTGHQAFFTTDALNAIAATTIHNICHFKNGDELENRVI